MAAPSSPSVNNKLKLLIMYLSFFTTFMYISPTYYASANNNVDIAAKAPTTRIFTRLIHRDSIHSPYYNPNSTAEDRAKSDLKRSMIRFDYLQAKIQEQDPNDDRVVLIADDIGAEFLANISIGEPPVPQLVAMDTGSELLWVQCQPCYKCFKQFSPIFDPFKSSTYANVSCEEFFCYNNPSNGCGAYNTCKYYVGYLDGTNTTGNLATEQIALETSDEGITYISGIVFGCGHDNNGPPFEEQRSGVLGLGAGPASLVSQLGPQFSYCIGDIKDPRYIWNNLIIGNNARIEGDLSPLERYNGAYYLTMEGISVGTKLLDINPTAFKRKSSGEGGVIIDSGATLTFLLKDAYEPLSNEVQDLLNGVLERIPDPYNPSILCYKGTIDRDLQGFPTVTFKFAGGAELGLDTGSLFRKSGPDSFCMSVYQSTLGKNLSIIGVMAQQYYNVGFDIVGNKISFLRIACEQLET